MTAAERYIGSWTLRLGVFDLSNVPNSPHLDPGFHEFQIDAELEKRYGLFGQVGRALITLFDSRGRMGLLDQAIAYGAATDTTPRIAGPFRSSRRGCTDNSNRVKATRRSWRSSRSCRPARRSGAGGRRNPRARGEIPSRQNRARGNRKNKAPRTRTPTAENR